jgi:AraC family transcriptional regulator of adaptative response/methylated-DNA-[protein]-cysteine methyltransferase
LRKQVEFYTTSEGAERAGFRPCRRCRPQQAVTRDSRTELAERERRQIEANVGETQEFATLDSLSDGNGVNGSQLRRAFKQVMGITPRQYADALRLDRLKARLKSGQNVTEALYDAGYGSSRALYERAPSQLGMTPATYRKGGRGMRITYIIVDCPLGRLLVAATNRGICSVCLGDSDSTLKRALFEEYPSADILEDRDRHGHDGLRRWVATLVGHLGGKTPHLDLPIDVQATAFQWRVWQELRRIPYGRTRSYTEVAERLGDPKAVRAVARACAMNPVALVIPCHRVVGLDGDLRGYRWGLERKRTLLEQERKAIAKARG